MDTSHLEHVAEDLISHKLQQAGLLVAKPKFDKDGTDLLAFAKMADGVKFCRIQCKGRTLNPSSNVTIPEHYVTSGFILFLYIESNDSVNELYCFIENDIRNWNKNPKNEYQLSLSQGTFASHLAEYRLNDAKVNLIKSIIAAAEINGEFRHMIYGGMNATTEACTMKAYGTYGASK